MSGINHTEIAQALLKDFNAFGEDAVLAQPVLAMKAPQGTRSRRRSSAPPRAQYGNCRAATRTATISAHIKVMSLLWPAGEQRWWVNANGFLTEDGAEAALAVLSMTYVLPYRYLARYQLPALHAAHA